jgi:hypothetical protein
MHGAIPACMRWWVTLTVVALTTVAAWGGPLSDTEQARQAMHVAEQQVASLNAKHDQLDGQLQHEKNVIDRLKLEKASWRRDRELRAKLADGKDMADQLDALDKQVAAAQARLATTRTQLVQAIDSELAAGATRERAVELGKLRAQLVAQPHAAKKIVIPDAEIDPLADPEDLEAQAAALRASEQELNQQVAGLDTQAKDFANQADLRKQHERAIDVFRRDDDQPLRTQAVAHTDNPASISGGGAGSGSGSTVPSGQDTANNDHGSTVTNSATAGSTGFENEATIVLGNVVDQATIDGLSRASRSGDPAQRADAAKRARDAVRARLELLQRKRAAIETRAKQLRGGK